MEDRTLAGRELRQRVFNTGSQVKVLCNRKASYSAWLEGMSRRALNVMYLYPTVGHFHELMSYQTKQWLVYDLQGPFRWIADVTVMKAFESGVLDLPDFYFTGDDYRYRFDPKAKQRFLDLLRERFNSGIIYKGRALKWDTVIERSLIQANVLKQCSRRLLVDRRNPRRCSV